MCLLHVNWTAQAAYACDRRSIPNTCTILTYLIYRINFCLLLTSRYIVRFVFFFFSILSPQFLEIESGEWSRNCYGKITILKGEAVF